MSREKIIDLISKVLNKSKNNPSKEECETAILMAQKLMAKHGIDSSEVESYSSEDEAIVDEIVFAAKRQDNTVNYLAQIIAENFRCKTYGRLIVNKTSKAQQSMTINFIGQRADVEITSKVFRHALNHMRQLAEGYALANSQWSNYNAKSVKHAFKIGFVSGLRAKFETQLKSDTTMALALRPKKEVQEALEQLDCKKQKHNADVRDTTSYISGVVAGGKYNYSAGEVAQEVK